MHANDDDTDVKNYGALSRAMRVTWITMAVSWLAIIGIIPFSGYWSKEQTLFSALAHGGVGTPAWVVGFVTAGITAFYMSRLFFLTFHGTARWPEGRHPHESPPIMTVPLVVLAAGAAVAGALNLSEDDGILARFLHPVFFAAGEEAPAVTRRRPGCCRSSPWGWRPPSRCSRGWCTGERYSWRPCAPAGPGCTALARKLGIDEAYEVLTVRAAGLWRRCSPAGSSGAWTAS